MKTRLFCLIALTIFIAPFQSLFSQENVVVTAEDSLASAGLDLHAVAELFKDSENLEALKKRSTIPNRA